MPAIKVTVTHQVNASIRLDESTVRLVDQYAAMMKVPADIIVNATLVQTLSGCKDFQAFAKTPQAAQAPTSLRVRRAPANGASESPAKKPPNGEASAVPALAVAAGPKA